jgi:FKBP-type peptidyl-prolyl cis-trans isomerase 2
MRTSQVGDRVQIHYVQTFGDGSVRSSRTGAGEPLEVTVGTDHRRLPGLGAGLVGLAEGQVVALDVPAERAFGPTDPARVKRVDRARFAADETLSPGTRTRMRLGRGRSRTVRVVEVGDQLVVVDLNHPRSGLSVHLEVELVTILETTVTEPDHRGA